MLLLLYDHNELISQELMNSLPVMAPYHNTVSHSPHIFGSALRATDHLCSCGGYCSGIVRLLSSGSPSRWSLLLKETYFCLSFNVLFLIDIHYEGLIN